MREGSDVNAEELGPAVVVDVDVDSVWGARGRFEDGDDSRSVRVHNVVLREFGDFKVRAVSFEVGESTLGSGAGRAPRAVSRLRARVRGDVFAVDVHRDLDAETVACGEFDDHECGAGVFFGARGEAVGAAAFEIFEKVGGFSVRTGVRIATESGRLHGRVYVTRTDKTTVLKVYVKSSV